MALIQLDNQREKRASLRHRCCRAVGPTCHCPPGADRSGRRSRSPGRTWKARGDRRTYRHTDSHYQGRQPPPSSLLPSLHRPQPVPPGSPFCAPGHRRRLPALTASPGVLRAPALSAPAASGAPAAPSALARQPSSRRLIAPRGSDVSPGINQSQAPIQIPAPFPRSAPPSLTMASAFTASPPGGQGNAPLPSKAKGPSACVRTVWPFLETPLPSPKP